MLLVGRVYIKGNPSPKKEATGALVWGSGAALNPSIRETPAIYVARLKKLPHKRELSQQGTQPEVKENQHMVCVCVFG